MCPFSKVIFPSAFRTKPNVWSFAREKLSLYFWKSIIRKLTYSFRFVKGNLISGCLLEPFHQSFYFHFQRAIFDRDEDRGTMFRFNSCGFDIDVCRYLFKLANYIFLANIAVNVYAHIYFKSVVFKKAAGFFNSTQEGKQNINCAQVQSSQA